MYASVMYANVRLPKESAYFWFIKCPKLVAAVCKLNEICGNLTHLVIIRNYVKSQLTKIFSNSK